MDRIFRVILTISVLVGGPILRVQADETAAGIYYTARFPLHGSYARDLLPGFLVMSLGAGAVFVSVTAAAKRSF